MTLATFTPATAYDHSYLYEPAAEAATLRLRNAAGVAEETVSLRRIVRHDIGSREWLFYAEAMGLPESSTVFMDWPLAGQPALVPRVDDEYLVGGVSWIITNVAQRHFGAGWACGVVRASDNG